MKTRRLRLLFSHYGRNGVRTTNNYSPGEPAGSAGNPTRDTGITNVSVRARVIAERSQPEQRPSDSIFAGFPRVCCTNRGRSFPQKGTSCTAPDDLVVSAPTFTNVLVMRQLVASLIGLSRLSVLLGRFDRIGVLHSSVCNTPERESLEVSARLRSCQTHVERIDTG